MPRIGIGVFISYHGRYFGNRRKWKIQFLEIRSTLDFFLIFAAHVSLFTCSLSTYIFRSFAERADRPSHCAKDVTKYKFDLLKISWLCARCCNEILHRLSNTPTQNAMIHWRNDDGSSYYRIRIHTSAISESPYPYRARFRRRQMYLIFRRISILWLYVFLIHARTLVTTGSRTLQSLDTALTQTYRFIVRCWTADS